MSTSKNGVSVTLKTITPALAEEFLSKNVKNRKILESQVDFYARQMKAEQWKLTGDSIKFSNEGALLDGQHRLRAIIKLGQPVDMFVAEGLDSDSFEVLDTGKLRTAGDVLSVFGVEKANNIGAIVRFIILFKRGSKTSWTKTDSPSHTDIVNFVSKHPNLNEILDFVHKVYRDFRYLQTSILGGLYFLFAEKNQTKADEFFEQYRTGLELTKTSPVYLLRDRFLRDQTNKLKLTRRDKIMLFIIAWNSFVSNKPMQHLKLPEKFPEII